MDGFLEDLVCFSGDPISGVHDGLGHPVPLAPVAVQAPVVIPVQIGTRRSDHSGMGHLLILVRRISPMTGVATHIPMGRVDWSIRRIPVTLEAGG